MDKVQVFKRADGKWGWHRKSENGTIVSTDGGQGYENLEDCLAIAKDVNHDAEIDVASDG